MILTEIPPFQPHPLLRGGHVQTIAGVYLPSRQPVYSAKQTFVQHDDGDQLVLHDDCPPQWQAGDRIAVLVHGLGGCHGSPYMVRIAGKLVERGVRVFRKDLRGWGAGAKVATRPFHAAHTDDITRALASIHQQAPTSPIAVIGFSLGANMVLKMLGDAGADCNVSLAGVDRALAIAPPIDLMQCCQYLSRGFGRVYDRKYAGFLWEHLRARADVVPEFAAALKEKQPKRIYDFDQRFTAPLGGFESVEHYYHVASSKERLRKIQVPTTILSAYDDPIVPGRVFDDAELSSQVTVHLTERGGHLGFIATAGREPDRRWMDWRVVDFVMA